MDGKNPLVNFVHLNCSCFGFTFVSLYFSVLVMMATLLGKLGVT